MFKTPMVFALLPYGVCTVAPTDNSRSAGFGWPTATATDKLKLAVG